MLAAPRGHAGRGAAVDAFRWTESWRSRGVQPRKEGDLMRVRNRRRSGASAHRGRVRIVGGGRLGPAAASTASAPGVTATTVTIGRHFSRSPARPPRATARSRRRRRRTSTTSTRTAASTAARSDYKYRDDGYNPTNTVKRRRKQLVLQDKVFAHLQRPRHADAHQGRRLPERLARPRPVRRLRLPVLGRARQAPVHVRLAARLHARGQDPRPVHQAELRGQEGRVLPARTTTSAPTASQGLDQYIPKPPGRDASRPTSRRNTDIAPQMRPRSQQSRAAGRGPRSPSRRYTALVELTALKLNYNPQLVVSNVGSDPTTLVGLLKAFSKGKATGRR